MRFDSRLTVSGKPGAIHIQVLRLLENFSQVQVEQAIKQAMDLGVVGFDAIKHLILCSIERRPAKLDLALYPYLPNASVKSTEPRAYLSLLQMPKANQQPMEARYD